MYVQNGDQEKTRLTPGIEGKGFKTLTASNGQYSDQGSDAKQIQSKHESHLSA